MHQLFLQVIGQVVLSTEEDDAALGDLDIGLESGCSGGIEAYTRYGEVPDQLVGIWGTQYVIDDIDILEFTTNGRCCLFECELIQGTTGLQRCRILPVWCIAHRERDVCNL